MPRRRCTLFLAALLFAAPMAAQRQYDVNNDPALQASWALLKYTRNAVQAGWNYDPNTRTTMVDYLRGGRLQGEWKNVYSSLPADLQGLIGPCMAAVPDAIRLTIDGWEIFIEERRNPSPQQERNRRVDAANRMLKDAGRLIQDAIACWMNARNEYIRRGGRRRDERTYPSPSPYNAPANPPDWLTPPAYAKAPCPESPTGMPNNGRFDLSRLREHFVRRITDLSIIDTGGRGLRTTDLQPGFDVLVNGTFFGARGPAGPIIINGARYSPPDDKGGRLRYRGGVAVTSSGEVVLLRQRSARAEDVARQVPGLFGFMGGGAVLVENRRQVSNRDLYDCQGFDAAAQTRLMSDQFRVTEHTVIAERDGAAYLIFTAKISGDALRNLLWQTGFTTAVMFDGGGPSYFYVRGGKPFSGGRAARYGVLVR